MTTPMFADVLEVHHHDDRVTTYRDVRYWPWPDGVSVFDADGNKTSEHHDVLQVLANSAVS